ncbi:TPA: site-specific DNA-methyltransferase [Streptococcus suis]|nr:site-specific DNA-methyltransferase [Streptococcus suis]
MIYIDPPYNTGKDFVYSDKFQMSEEELADQMDLRDEDGLQRVGLTKNEKSSARYHSDWLNMMYPRLVLARNLLKDSGVIFISIDDNEQANLKAICDEIFGEENFVADIYEIISPSGRSIFPPSGRSWLLSKERFEEFIADNRIWFGANGDNVPRIKRFLSEVKNTVTPMTIWKYADVGHSQSASQDLKKIFDGKAYFTYPKPVPLMKQIVQLYSEKDGLVLDFFAGSATTADAVMQLNAEDGGNRKYILCTLDEQVADKSAAKEAGYETIDQISRERIRRAAKKIQEEHPATVGKQDFGFRAYKLDSSNFKEVSQTPDSFSQESLFDSVSNIKDGRTDLDLLFQIMLTWGMELSHPIAKTQIDGTAVYNVADGALIACFADEISESVLRQIAKEEPLRAVFKDESFANSAAKINLGQIFKEEAPNTKVKVV